MAPMIYDSCEPGGSSGRSDGGNCERVVPFGDGLASDDDCQLGKNSKQTRDHGEGKAGAEDGGAEDQEREFSGVTGCWPS